MIKRIELINFMSHEHTVVEPSSGLTVLIGPNNCGKSAIVTALQILCNNPKSTYVLRHGAKECKVIVETDSGDVIQWSRKKNGSPKYVINGELFDRLKSKVPEQLHQILRMPQVQVDKESFDVHFGEQTSPLFLLGDKEKAAAQFFASSSDAIRLVEMQDRHRSNIKIAKADLKRVSKQRASLESQNTILAPVTALHKKAVECEKFGREIAAENTNILRLKDSVHTIEATQQRAELLSKQNETLREIPPPPALKPTLTIEILIQAIQASQRQAANAEAQLITLSDLHQPPKLQPTQRLQQWVQTCQQNERTIAIANGRYAALELLAEPPALSSTSVLAQTIELLENEQRNYETHNRRLQAIAQLPQVPKLESTAALTELLKRYDELVTLMTRQQGLLKSNDEEIAAVEAELEDWLDQNPLCPTCGVEVSKDQLLEKAGGHAHA